MFYENQTTENYKLGEIILGSIIKSRIKWVNNGGRMKNNMSEFKSTLKNYHVVYKTLCPREGLLTRHLKISAIKDQMINEHHKKLTRKQLL